MSNLLWRITKQLFIFGAACFTFLILVVIGSMYWDMYQENKVLGMSAAISPTPIPTFTLTPTPTAKIQKKAYVAPVKDTDPAVHCQRHPNCGGGSIPLKQSECSNMTCCGNHDGTWKFVPKNQCNNGSSATTSNNSEAELLRMKIQAMNETSKSIQDSIDYMNASRDTYKTLGKETEKNIQNIGPGPNQYNPSPIDSGKRCYSSWDEYFKAHPGYVGNVAGLGSNPPCE